MSESRSLTNPFPGLRPFETDEYRLFFGREGQSDALITRLQRSRFLAVVGTSGSGKSSLVRAGLLPALRGGMMSGAGSGWRICIMRPGSDPFGNLAHSLAENDVLPEAGGGLPRAEAEAAIEAQLRSGSLGLVDAAKNARLAEPEKLLILVDQFEELFRFRAARGATSIGDEAAAFVKLLLEAAQQRELSLYVVLTMRSDFLGDCAQFQGLPEAINDGQYLIPRMTRDERRIAIAGPVGVTRGKMAEPLINRLLNDVGDNPDQLPILQHALMRTWDYWAAHRRNGEPIALDHYEAIGTMSEALSLHADEAWQELPNEPSRSVAEKLFKALTEKGTDNREIRRPTRLSEIAAGAEVTEAEVVAVIEVFRREGRSFLMPPAGVHLHSDTVIDISHESLIRNWDRLQKWVDEEAQSARIYRRLAEAAVLHREGGEALLQDPALQIALDWRDKSRPNAAWAGRYHPNFAEAMTFLNDSKSAHEADLAAKEKQREEQLARERRELEMARDFAEKQARAVRRMRWLTAGMAVMFVLALFTAGFAVYAQQLAKGAEVRAVEARKGVEIEKEKVAQALKETERRREEAAALLEQRDRAEVGMRQAQDDQAKQLEKALAAEEHAKNEAERANTEAKNAADNLAATQKVTTAASSIVRRAVPIVEQGDLLLKGSEEYRRAEWNEALKTFNRLREQLEGLKPGSSTAPAQPNLTIAELERFAKTIGDAEQFEMQRGWTSSHIGSTYLRKGDLPKAIENYEQALQIFKRTPASSSDRIMFETELGLAQAYHASGLNRRSAGFGPLNGEAREDFQKSEEHFQSALNFQLGDLVDEESVAADTVLKLARLYVDAGKFDLAETNFKRAVNGRRQGPNGDPLDNNGRAALAAAMRELGEFYQGQEAHQDDAVKVFNEMIDVQEASGLAVEGLELVNSYADLGQIYTAKGEKEKSAGAFFVANLIQRASLKFRQLERFRGSDQKAWHTLLAGLETDLDELGDAYLKLGRLNSAEAVYREALSDRERDANDDVEKRKSWGRLANIYRIKKEYAKAEEYQQLLVKFYHQQSWGPDYAKALVQLSALYSEAPNRSADAESNYRTALNIYQELHDWYSEDVILFRLSKLYESQKRLPERDQARRDRVDTLERYFKQLETKASTPPKDYVALVWEYLYAINALGYGNKNRAEAEATYQKAYAAYAYIMANIYNQKMLTFYADTLKGYRVLIKDQQARANEVAAKEKEVRTAVQKLDQVSSQQNVSRSDPGATQATAP